MSQDTKNKNLTLQKNNLSHKQGQSSLDRSKFNAPATQSKSSHHLSLASQERNVSSLPAEYTDLLKPKTEPFSFEKQILPIGAILLFSLVLVFLMNLGKNSSSNPVGRGISGQLTDLSNGEYTHQSADYEQEQTCVDHPDGTKSCTTRTKLKRSFR